MAIPTTSFCLTFMLKLNKFGIYFTNFIYKIKNMSIIIKKDFIYLVGFYQRITD